ncbi:uncharacterized protein LOC143283850 [Babylonia areolata]|uniref:uncharacterized protein LOC143283850 n=1 Tax=Babylonia areolata TaxID=304850 RepID=UPI003FD1FEF2
MISTSGWFALLAVSVLTSGQYLDPHCEGKQVIVHLFEWKWTEVAKECERFLGPWGFCGVQVSPPNEHVRITSPPYPWWQRYQPVSYKLVSRGGNEAEFKDMVQRCNAVGVRIYAGVVVNHMAGSEYSGRGWGGTSFDGGSLSYPGVPYSAANFNPRSKCPSGDGHVNNYGDPNNVRNCYLLSLTDLDQSQEHVRKMIVGYFDHLLDLGVAGFRVDASKHMWPRDLEAIQAATRDTRFGGRPFYMHEVIDQNDGAIKVNEYYSLGRVTEFRYCQKITEGVHDFGRLRGVVDYGWGMADNDHALVFVDNHDNQRGHGGGGRITTHERPLDYRLATAFTLAWDYGFTRVMSSYEFGDNSDQGPPHLADFSTADVPVDGAGQCGGGWVCEHRWPSIRGMALFRNHVAGTPVLNYYSGNDVVAFSRGNKGFFAMGKRGFDQTFQTGLPAGQYCDLISNCQQKVSVDSSGQAHVHPASSADPVVAFIVEIFTNKVGVSVDAEDIEMAHRSGRPGTGKPRPILVRFYSRQKKKSVLENRRKLKQSGISIGGPTGPIEAGAVGAFSANSGNSTAGTSGTGTVSGTGTGTSTDSPLGLGHPQTASPAGSGSNPASTTARPVCDSAWSAVVSGADVVSPGPYLDPHCGGRQVIVQLFEWKWTDVAAECERYLGPRGFCGVQVSPASEHPVVTSPPHPWWERYEPVSYKLVSRSGTEAQFADMVARCNAVGVRIFVDVQLNHMTGTERSGTGIAGTPFTGSSLDYPGVPFAAHNFNTASSCPSGDGHIHNYGDAQEVRNCQLLTLSDLDQSQPEVQQKQAEFLNHMLSLGVAGFRLDASKHMWPRDLNLIEGLVNDTVFGGRPFFIHEVIDFGDGAIRGTEYTDLGYVTEFRYGGSIVHGLQDWGYLQRIGSSGMLDPGHALVFVDNHDNQRGHGAGGNMLTFRSPQDYMLAQAFTLAWNYGLPRVMSSYRFTSPDDGPPHEADFSTADVPINSDSTCGGGWVCEHRWPAIGNMAAFRNHVTGTDVSHYWREGEVVGFARGTKGFFAMGKQGFDQTFQTGLPAGQYCDLISNCQQKVSVDNSGQAHLTPFSQEVPVVAFVVDGPTTGCDVSASATGGSGSAHGSVSSSGPVGSTPAPTSAGPEGTTEGPEGTTVDYGNSSWRRTVILVERHTNPGQNLFIRGGIGHDHRQGCTDDAATSACSIPIRHRDTGSGSHYAGVRAWGKGDHFLDWYGPEVGQGTFQGRPADGTPAVWTTNDPNHPGYSLLNTFGGHYWLVDVDMDCSKTDGGYFEFKSIVGGWEGNIPAVTCTGSGSGSAPFTSVNHVARCGFLNVYHFGRAACTIQPL